MILSEVLTNYVSKDNTPEKEIIIESAIENTFNLESDTQLVKKSKRHRSPSEHSENSKKSSKHLLSPNSKGENIKNNSKMKESSKNNSKNNKSGSSKTNTTK